MGDPLRLYGLNALVLNAADGIGEAIARTLVKHGATVMAADASNSGVVQNFSSVKGIIGHAANLNDPDELAALVQEAVDTLGGLDIVVNDFLFRHEAPVVAVDDALERVLRMRATLIMAVCRAALPHMKTSPAGRIINIGFLRSFFAADADARTCRGDGGIWNHRELHSAWCRDDA